MRPFHFSSHRFVRLAWSCLILSAVLAASLLLSGCAETGQMNDQPRFNPLSATTLFPDGRSARPSVPNTVSYSADNSANSPTNTGLGADGQPLVGFPEPVTRDLVARGQDRYNIYCTPCHGPSG